MEALRTLKRQICKRYSVESSVDRVPSSVWKVRKDGAFAGVSTYKDSQELITECPGVRQGGYWREGDFLPVLIFPNHVNKLSIQNFKYID